MGAGCRVPRVQRLEQHHDQYEWKQEGSGYKERQNSSYIHAGRKRQQMCRTSQLESQAVYSVTNVRGLLDTTRVHGYVQGLAVSRAGEGGQKAGAQ